MYYIGDRLRVHCLDVIYVIKYIWLFIKLAMVFVVFISILNMFIKNLLDLVIVGLLFLNIVKCILESVTNVKRMLDCNLLLLVNYTPLSLLGHFIYGHMISLVRLTLFQDMDTTLSLQLHNTSPSGWWPYL